MTQRNSEARRAMLADRRQRQRSLTSGFQPVRNQRINNAIEANTLIVQMAKPFLSPVEAQQEAINQVAKMLPHPPMRRSYAPKPSKNDSAAYRGVGGAGPVRQQVLG